MMEKLLRDYQTCLHSIKKSCMHIYRLMKEYIATIVCKLLNHYDGRVYVHVCPRVHKYRVTSGVILTLNDWLNNRSCFSDPFYGTCR